MRGGLDFGTVRRAPSTTRMTTVIVVVSVVAIVALAAAVLFDIWRTAQATAKADAKLWTVVGPPCPVITADWWVKLAITNPQSLAFEGLDAQRAHGDVSCSVIDRDHGRAVSPYPICQFSGPFAIRLQTARGDVYFEPGVGQPATVSLPNGQPRCVIGVSAASNG